MQQHTQQQLSGKKIVVTGGFGHLGSALGSGLVDAGAKVVLIDLAKKPAADNKVDRALELGGVDLLNAEAVNDAFDKADSLLGGIDGLVNVAGGFAWETVEGGLMETWDKLYAMNVRTAVAACRAALPKIKAQHDGSSGGRIVNIGAAGAIKAGMGMGAYAASKSGVAKLTESLAEELKQNNITVNAVLPSILDTPVNRADMPDADFSTWVSLKDLANVIIFLLSDNASVITGACLPVTGRV